jgi:hypothetical protein
VLERKKKMDAALHSKKKKALEKKFEAAVRVCFPYFRLLIREKRNKQEDSNSYKENGLLW